MNFNNKYVIRGILLILLGFMAVFWNFGIISIFEILMIIIPVAIIFFGVKYSKYGETRTLGQIMIFIGLIFLIFKIGIPMKFIIAITLILPGIYFLFFKSNLFKSIIKTGLFKDSREHIIINEWFSDIIINSVSTNLSTIKINSFFSKIFLDLSRADLNSNFPVNLDAVCAFGGIKIRTNSSFNVMLNGKLLKKVEGAQSTLNIRFTSVLGDIDIY